MDINIFARRLKECRTNAGLNVRELGERIGVSGANVSRYENAIHGPGRDTLAEMVDLFNVNPAWLMGASSEKYLNKAKICKRIPVTSHIPAGHLDITKENIIDYEYVEETSLIDFCFIVKGDSMINARILDGDLVYVRKQSSVENGEIAVVLIDDEEATLKRFLVISRKNARLSQSRSTLFALGSNCYLRNTPARPYVVVLLLP